MKEAIGKLLLAAALCQLPFARVVGAEDNSCVRFNLPAVVDWVSSLAWLDEPAGEFRGGNLIIADPSKGRILSFDPKIGEISIFSPSRKLSDGGWAPTAVFLVGKELLVKSSLQNAQLLGLGSAEGGLPFRLWDAAGSTGVGRGTGLGSLYPGWVTLDDGILGYGSITNRPADAQGETSQGGILLARLDRTEGRLVQPRMLVSTEENDYYRLGLDYFASNLRAGYFVLHDPGRGVSLSKVDSSRRVSSVPWPIPASFSKYRKLENAAGNAVVSLFKEIESRRMVAGLYASNEFLFVLTREPLHELVKWDLYKLDLDGHLIGRAELPTRSLHLNVEFAGDRFFLIEKGRVFDWGKQEISSILVLSTSWLDAAIKANGVAPARCTLKSAELVGESESQ